MSSALFFTIISLLILLFLTYIFFISNTTKSKSFKFFFEKGDAKIKPTWKKLLFWTGVAGNSKELSFNINSELEFTYFKLFGLTNLDKNALIPFLSNRIDLYGWSEYPNMSHENSERVLAKIKDGEVRLGVYRYVNGYGGISSEEELQQFDRKHPKLSEGYKQSRSLGSVKLGESFSIKIDLSEDHKVTYVFKSKNDRNEYTAPRYTKAPKITMCNFAHHDNGPNTSSEGRIDITARIES